MTLYEVEVTEVPADPDDPADVVWLRLAASDEDAGVAHARRIAGIVYGLAGRPIPELKVKVLDRGAAGVLSQHLSDGALLQVAAAIGTHAWR